MAQYSRIALPGGAALYFDPLPQGVNPVCFKLVVMAGSADDMPEAHGAHHWFEHVPFRGTEAFPEGTPSTMGRFARYAGHIGAYTGNTSTVFYGRVPKSMWRDALEVVIDLAARPLLREADVEAERLIIKEEIKQRNSSPETYLYDHLPGILWSGHPYAHSILGTEESLTAADPAMIAATHAKSYSPERCSLFVSGNIPLDMFARYATELFGRMPQRKIGARPLPALYGVLPEWQMGKYTEVETSFDTSHVLLLFPYQEAARSLAYRPIGPTVRGLFSSGGLVSPLYRIVREERKLVYSTQFYWIAFPDGGCWGFEAKCGAGNVPAVIEAFKDVLKDAALRSDERFAYVRDAFWGRDQMKVLDPYNRASSMFSSLATYGAVLSEDELTERVMDITHAEALSMLDEFAPERAHTIVFKGTKQ